MNTSTGNTTYDTIIAIALGAVALAALWRQIIRPGLRAFGQVDKLYNLTPVINQMALEFKNNHGSSLKDQIDRIERRLEEVNEIKKMVQKLIDANAKAKEVPKE